MKRFVKEQSYEKSIWYHVCFSNENNNEIIEMKLNTTSKECRVRDLYTHWFTFGRLDRHWSQPAIIVDHRRSIDIGRSPRQRRPLSTTFSLSSLASWQTRNTLVVKSFDLDNLVMKFIIISSQGATSDSWYCISSYFAWVACLFLWQLWHFFIYASTFYLMCENWQCCRKNYNVFETLECFCNESSWCSLIYLLTCDFDICNFSWYIGNYSF